MALMRRCPLCKERAVSALGLCWTAGFIGDPTPCRRCAVQVRPHDWPLLPVIILADPLLLLLLLGAILSFWNGYVAWLVAAGLVLNFLLWPLYAPLRPVFEPRPSAPWFTALRQIGWWIVLGLMVIGFASVFLDA